MKDSQHMSNYRGAKAGTIFMDIWAKPLDILTVRAMTIVRMSGMWISGKMVFDYMSIIISIYTSHDIYYVPFYLQFIPRFYTQTDLLLSERKPSPNMLRNWMIMLNFGSNGKYSRFWIITTIARRMNRL